jgi:hypothetical protein
MLAQKEFIAFFCANKDVKTYDASVPSHECTQFLIKDQETVTDEGREKKTITGKKEKCREARNANQK